MLSQLINLFSRNQKQSRMFWSTGPIQKKSEFSFSSSKQFEFGGKKDKSFQSNTTNQPFCCLLQYAVEQTSFILLTLTHLCILQPESLKQWLKYAHTGSQIEITFLWDCSQRGTADGWTAWVFLSLQSPRGSLRHFTLNLKCNMVSISSLLLAQCMPCLMQEMPMDKIQLYSSKQQSGDYYNS